VTYRAELSNRALKQMHGLPGQAFGGLVDLHSTETVIILDVTWTG